MNRIRRRGFLLVAVVSAFALLAARPLRADESAAHKEAREAVQKAASKVKEARNNLEDAEGLEKSIPKSAKEEKARAKAAVEKAKKELEDADKDRDKKYKKYMEISRDEAEAYADEMRAKARSESERRRGEYLAEQERKKRVIIVDTEAPQTPSDSQQPGTPQTDTPQTEPPKVETAPQAPAAPLDRKALEKKIKDAEAKAKRAGHNASHQNRVADQLAKQKRDEEAAFARKVANGFLRERGEALNEAAEAKKLLADLKAGRTPQPPTSAPIPPGQPGTPGETSPASGTPSGVPGAPSGGVPSTGAPSAGAPSGPSTPSTPASGSPGPGAFQPIQKKVRTSVRQHQAGNHNEAWCGTLANAVLNLAIGSAEGGGVEASLANSVQVVDHLPCTDTGDPRAFHCEGIRDIGGAPGTKVCIHGRNDGNLSGELRFDFPGTPYIVNLQGEP